MNGKQNTTRRIDKHKKLKEVRTYTDFMKFIEWLHEDSSADIITVIRCHENIWNRIFVLFHTKKTNGYDLVTSGKITLEIRHPFGVLILINNDYAR